MEDSTDADNLRNLLTRSWQLDVNESRRARDELMQKQWTVSSLTELYLRDRIDSYRSTNGSLDKDQDEHGNVASLASIATSKINDLLATSDNIDADISTITDSLNSTTLRQFFRDGKTPYTILRAFLDMPMNAGSNSPGDSGAREPKVTFNSIQDIDEAVLLNERYIRSRTSLDNLDDRYLVSLEDLARILGKPQQDTSPTWTFKRKDPPRGGYEFLDENRKRTVEIISDSNSYSSTFARITGGILNGLDWNNVLVAGGMALTALLVDHSTDHAKVVQQSDLDIYIYGLDVETANKKVEEIYQVWKRNLPATNHQQLVVKNAKTINFIPDYPNQRVQIVLKLLISPPQVLIKFDLDACAVGFDGKHVLMLPRCARAIETGYSVFVMDLVWDHYLGQRRAPLERRVLKYADRGFGLRILPCYVKSLEVGSGREIGGDLHSDVDTDDTDGDETSYYSSLNLLSFPAPRLLYHTCDEYRMPQGPEPGLKTLKRVACLGQDFTNRLCWDNTPLHTPKLGSPYREGWIEDYETRKKLTQRRIEKFHDPLYVAETTQLYRLDDLDYSQSLSYNLLDPFGNLSSFVGSLSSFEMSSRYAEAWTLNARPGPQMFDMEKCISLIYHADAFDDYSEYKWDSVVKLSSLVRDMDLENNALFDALKEAISEKLQIPYQDTGYSGYLTRRIRRQVYGPDLQSVMEKQITIPLIVPYDFEQFLRRELPNICSDLPSHYLSNPFLIPIHDPAGRDPSNPGIIPSLHDTASEAGNLRYWVITNQSMWACQHRAMDEVYEILWSLFDWFEKPESSDCAQPKAVWYMAQSLRRRAVSPNVSSVPPADDERLKVSAAQNITNGLTAREAMLFRPWILAEPLYRTKNFADHELRRGRGREGFEDDAYLYPVPDELFWKDGDEGEWDSEYVPQWREVPDEDEKGKNPVGRKRKMEDMDAQEVIVVEDD